MMNVCLINPLVDHKSFLQPDSHLGLAYIASTLSEEGYHVDIIDSPIEELSYVNVFERLSKKKYDAIGISTYFYNFHSAVRILKHIKKTSSAFVFLGGYLPTLANDIMKGMFAYVDCMVIGEGEKTTLTLLNNFQKGDWKSTLGICYLKENEICYTGPVKLADLDSLPFPIRKEEYIKNSVQVASSRGCYGHCSFCGIMEFYESSCGKYGEVRRRSPANMVKEIEELVGRYHVEHFNFVDDNFYFNSSSGKSWIKEFCGLIKEKQLDISFNISVRANEIVSSYELLDDLIEIGLDRVFIGVESFLDSHLRLYNKKTTAKMNLEAIKILDQYDFKYEIGYLIFNPITTIDDILQTVDIFRKNEINYKHKHIWTPISASVVNSIYGTPLHTFIQEHKCFARNDRGYDFLSEDTQLCYKYMSKWNDKVNLIYQKSSLYNQAKKQNDSVTMERCKELFYKLYYMDLALLEKVALIISEDSKIHNLEKIDFLMEEAEQKLGQMSNELEEVAKDIQKDNGLL